VSLPHLVCLGAEKNFNKLAERMEEDGDPAYFYAERNWNKLRATRGMGLRKICGLVEILCAAAKR
jgi:hypothetical protein